MSLSLEAVFLCCPSLFSVSNLTGPVNFMPSTTAIAASLMVTWLVLVLGLGIRLGLGLGLGLGCR